MHLRVVRIRLNGDLVYLLSLDLDSNRPFILALALYKALEITALFLELLAILTSL